MKHLQSGSFQYNPFMRLTLRLSLLLLSAFWLTNWGMLGARMGFSPASIAAYYLGSESEFRQARSVTSMLETAHMHLPMMALLLLLLTHLLIFAPYRDRTKYVLISAAFLSALAEEGSGWLVRFVHPGFAWLKLGSFLLLQGLIAFMLAGLALFLGRMTGEGHPGTTASGGKAAGRFL